MGACLDHAPGVARGAHAAPLSRVPDQEVVSTLVTEGARETVGENEEFDEIVGRIQDRHIEYFADPAAQQRGQITRHFGGRGDLLGRPRRAPARDHHGALRRLRGDDPGLAESAGMFLGSAARLPVLSGEELMKELNGDGAFTDR
jgi:hypothetical protein